MSEIAAIATALTSIQTAAEIVKMLRESSSSLEQAELKLQLAEIIMALADAKSEMATIQFEVLDKDKKIEELCKKLKNKSATLGFKGARYMADEAGEPEGSPFCQTCWAVSGDLIPLTHPSRGSNSNVCGKCDTKVATSQSPLDAGHYIKTQRESGEKIGMPFELKTMP